MGRLESLTALALGRGPYEDELLDEPPNQIFPTGQQYNEHGHPRNPETKRREREHVRAANEVMQVTGVVEDSNAAKLKAAKYLRLKTNDTLTGLRLMEFGRAALVGGVWGVLGLRRRILLYKPYAQVGLLQILQNETAQHGALTVFGAGLPAVLAYHIADWVQFFGEAFLDTVLEEDEDTEEGKIEKKLTESQLWLKRALQILLDLGFSYITLHFRMFAILQQLGLIPSSRLLPTLRSFIPFSYASPLQIPSIPFRPTSLVPWTSVLLRSATPMLMILLHGKVKFLASRILYRHIYTLLPRPTGESMFSGMQDASPIAEFDTPDRGMEERTHHRAEDEPTLRALEGLPALERTETRSRQIERDSDSSVADDGEVTHATLISFDVEATEAVESPLGALGTWSAELRSANEPKQSDEPRYRVTGLTVLPPIMATEGLREIIAGIIVMPVEAAMVRVIGHACRASSGSGMGDIYPVTSGLAGFGLTGVDNIIAVLLLQLGLTGVVWAGFTVGTQWWASRNRESEGETQEKVV
ncbi:hypothetical protein G7Y89_g4486 [Cudoniella acicularis]|uniref:Uncharacterized protein n=1 Tax=Cudoniella acicularis TaxID=354080 RepID=A0A8H4RRH3_9HELO|nr:hypothetical protein G7Y89_g4486 [Cudoniella acicularis]